MFIINFNFASVAMGQLYKNLLKTLIINLKLAFPVFFTPIPIAIGIGVNHWPEEV